MGLTKKNSLFSNFNVAPAVGNDGWHPAEIKKITEKDDAWYVSATPYEIKGGIRKKYASVLMKLEHDCEENSVADKFMRIFAKAKSIKDIEGKKVELDIRISEGKTKTYYNVVDIAAYNAADDLDEDAEEDVEEDDFEAYSEEDGELLEDEED